jgi:hypothetical protein
MRCSRRRHPSASGSPPRGASASGSCLPVSIDFSFFAGGLLLVVLLGRWLKVSAVTLTTIAVAAIVGGGLGGMLKPVLAVAGLIPH